MTTSSAPCTTLSVMTTMSDLTDDFRLHAFAAGLSLLHHRFDRAQVFVDFANKSADAPAATLSKGEALSNSLIAILRRARVLRGESSVSVLRYGTDASKYEALLARAFGVDAAEAARLASATVSIDRPGTRVSKTCYRMMMDAAKVKGTPFSLPDCERAMAAAPSYASRVLPQFYKTSFALAFSIDAAPADCPYIFHADFPRLGRTSIVEQPHADHGDGGVVGRAIAAMRSDDRVYAVCLPWEKSAGTPKCTPVPADALAPDAIGPSGDDWCIYHKAHGAKPFFSMQAFVADARRFRRAWPYPNPTDHIESIIANSHTDRHFPLHLRSNATRVAKQSSTTLNKLLAAAQHTPYWRTLEKAEAKRLVCAGARGSLRAADANRISACSLDKT